MLVRALQLGYYGNIRIKEGQLFKLKNPKDFSEKWMRKSGKKGKGIEVNMEAPKPIESPLVQESEDGPVGDHNSDVI